MEIKTSSIANAQSASFKDFVNRLVQKFKPLQLFCFAESSLIKEGIGCFTEANANAYSHYCLLMVTETDVSIERAVTKFNARSAHDQFSVLCYSKRTVALAFIVKDRFFLTIYSSAKLLYSKEEILQSEYIRKYSDLNNYRKAQRKSSHYLALIDSFFAGATFSFYDRSYAMCVLMLHHVTRQCLTVLIRVHLYHQIEHRSLITLVGLCRSFSNQPWQLLLAGDEDKQLFEILVKSCSEEYGITSFSVTEADAKQLFLKVSTLIKSTRILCKDRLEQLNKQAFIYEQSLTSKIAN